MPCFATNYFTQGRHPVRDQGCYKQDQLHSPIKFKLLMQHRFESAKKIESEVGVTHIPQAQYVLQGID